ncbi:MAG: arylsulfatase [Verrucomicrobia bacterium]|nr:arylsulfatase [Verrucomicrobiota bacterium]
MASPLPGRPARLSICFLLLAGLLRAAASDSPPNIVLIYADDLGYGDVGCYGATKVRTPHIDRLAREGRRFTDAHSASAACTPSRYALLTGEYPFRVDNWGPIFGRAGLIIDPAKTTLASLLRGAGYATACIGKWHLGFGTKTPDWNGELKPGPLELGFDWYYGLPTVSSHAPYVLVENHRVLGLDPADPLVFGGLPETPKYPEKILNAQAMSGARAAHALYQDDQLGTLFTQKATTWIRQQRGRPFFLYFATPQIHHPFTPHPRFQGTSDCGRYGDFIHELDWMVGEILATLDELRLADHTLVIFTSDNGGMLNEGGQDAWRAGHRANGELLGYKFGAWEGGHRVPFLVRWPGRVPAGSTSSQLIANLDLLATFAALTGRKLDPAAGPDSFNQLATLTGSPAAPIREHLVLQPIARKNVALRSGPWVYISAQGDGGFSGIRGGPGSVAFSERTNSDITPDGKIRPEAPPDQLYNLATDFRQERNVVREHPEVAARMIALLRSHRENTRTAPLP